MFVLRYDNVGAGDHRALPGGGPGAGGSPRADALRELREATGWTDLEPGPLLCTREHAFTHSYFTHSGVPARRHEHPYITRGPRREPAGPQPTAAHAAGGIPAWRRWSREELPPFPDRFGCRTWRGCSAKARISDRTGGSAIRV
ncbi:MULTISPECIES: NUDIX domain-containing protein [unclassified Streptomyces]|uniref:NUDIX domain-containing protein n=1 Tax=unclassified Streptomyces TaxID=2593676 RepID=UPI001F038DB2|nr:MULTISPECIES: NUDIX domain-containing protein [unclassified Streptomyces]